MPEKGGLDQLSWDGSTVDLNKRLLGTPRKPMDSSSDQFLPGPILSGDQHARFGGRHLLHTVEHLPDLITAVRETGSPVLWVCDPMHGNTESTADGTKTRRFENIISELESAFRIHQSMGSILGGVHLELTGENVTECTGGARGLTDGDLARAYKTTVDPRLNYEQAMEVAMRIAGLHQTD